MRLVADHASDVGLVRPGNEDALYCGERVFAVADGLGGHAYGEVASELAVEGFKELDGDVLPSDIATAQSWLAEGVKYAGQQVIANAQANPERAGMGTTLTASAVVDGHLLLAHVGDSRAYLHRGGDGLHRLTVDHTPPGEAAAQGHLSLKEADHHPESHVLTRVVGGTRNVEVDTPEPVSLAPGDRILLCSDGLTAVLEDEQLAEILDADDEPTRLCARMVDAARSGGGPDNITVVVVRVDEPGEG